MLRRRGNVPGPARLALLLTALAATAIAPTVAAEVVSADLPTADPEAEGIDSGKLIELAEWIRDSKLPIYSVLVSHGGKLVLELYTGGIHRDHSHYVMSVTKSVQSAGIGVAVDRGLIGDPDRATISSLLAPGIFKSEGDRRRFEGITLKHVLGMSALDATTPPHDPSAAAWERQRAFWGARNRVAFAVTQPAISRPGVDFQYNDINPVLATGVLVHAASKSAFDFLREALFQPMGFKNAEWMHSDPSGVDNGGYGLRLRPLDMQKLGILYLRKGMWGAQRLLSTAWVERSFRPWIKTYGGQGEPNYGWSWWTNWFPSGWRGHSANGWRGQRIWVFPEQDVVVTTTAYLEENEGPTIDRVVSDFVIPAVERARGKALAPTDHKRARLAALLVALQRERPRGPKTPEPRMIPSAKKKEKRRPAFHPM